MDQQRIRSIILKPGAPLLAAAALMTGCASSPELGDAERDYREAYEVYPAATSDGMSKHLLRSHTTAILVRPGSSAVDLCARCWNQVRDVTRRIEMRLIRFPTLAAFSAPQSAHGPERMDLVAWEKWLDQLTGKPTSYAKVEFIANGKQFYDELAASIEGARHSIDLQTYLFDNDDVARDIADRLRARSNEVEVRVIYDGLGTYKSHTDIAPSQPVDTEFIEHMPRYLCEGSNIRLRVVPNIWLTGNHVKRLIFDERVAYIGGMNIGREYRHDWHDVMLRVEGRAVAELMKGYNKTWRHCGWGGDFSLLIPDRKAHPVAHEVPGEVPVRFLRTRSTSHQIYRAQLEAIKRAQSYIYIENCYFSDDQILLALCAASRRGVDVRLVLPIKANHKIMARSNRIAINTLLKHGARVYLYPRMTHAKAAVYDGWACVGTANFDKLSLQIIHEINLSTSHPETVEQLIEQLFEPDFAASQEITEPVEIKFTDHLYELIGDET